MVCKIEPRSFPIALAMGAILLLVAAISGKAIYKLEDAYVILSFFIGILVFVISTVVYVWERNRYYQSKLLEF